MHDPDPNPEMNPEQGRYLAGLMASMAEGDQSVIFALVESFGDRIAGVVRAQLAGYGRRDLLADPDEMTGLVHVAAFEILDRAGSWDPAGAPPWVWAAGAIRAAVVREIGHARADVEIDGLDGLGIEWASAAVPGGEVDLDAMAAGDGRLSLLLQAIAATGSDRDAHVVRQYLIQQALGDPSPSHTVAGEYGLSPDNVRQIVSRVRRKVRRLQAADDRYRELGRSGWLAA